MLVHATTELFFDIPADAKSLEVGYAVNPDSYENLDYDGVTFHFDFLDENEELVPWKYHWMNPNEDYHVVHHDWDFPDDRTDRLVMRVLPGPNDNNAYDQALLHYLRFETGD